MGSIGSAARSHFWEPHSQVDERCCHGAALVSCDWLRWKVDVKLLNELLLMEMFETDLLIRIERISRDVIGLRGCQRSLMPLLFIVLHKCQPVLPDFKKWSLTMQHMLYQQVLCRRGDTVACVFVHRIISKQFLKVHTEVKIRSKEYSASLRQGSLTCFFHFSSTKLLSVSIFRNSAEDHTYSEPFSR